MLIFSVPKDHIMKIKENKKREKYLDLARELKILLNMKVTVMPIVIGELGMIPKGLVRGLEELKIGGRAVTIINAALLRLARILSRVPETRGNLLSLRLF